MADAQVTSDDIESRLSAIEARVEKAGDDYVVLTGFEPGMAEHFAHSRADVCFLIAQLRQCRREAFEEAAKIADKAAQPMECDYLTPMDPTTGVIECSLSNRGRDCFCLERQEAAEAIAQALRARALKDQSK